MTNGLPTSVRYVKNGEGSQWWPAAKKAGQIHLGWKNIAEEILSSGDLNAIRKVIAENFGPRRGATQNFNELKATLDRPSQHVWVTFQDGCMWWCTVRDGITFNPRGESKDAGNFWLTCDRPWNSYSLQGRHLVTAELPGVVTTTAAYQKTICEPKGWREILRIIQDEDDPDAARAAAARAEYERAVGKLVSRLRARDFELLVDLILSRSGWVRRAKLGGVTEGIDVEAENVATNETAFVQVKSTADQGVLDDYVDRFSKRRDHYHRMIFAVHSPKGALRVPKREPVQVWTGERIAQLVVGLGLGEWVARRL